MLCTEEKKPKSKDKDSAFITEEAKKATISPARVAEQKRVDAALSAALTPEFTAYLSARFSLTHGQYPHDLRF
jgi:hypothetical protein